MLRSGIAGIRDSTVLRTKAVHDTMIRPPPPLPQNSKPQVDLKPRPPELLAFLSPRLSEGSPKRNRTPGVLRLSTGERVVSPNRGCSGGDGGGGRGGGGGGGRGGGGGGKVGAESRAGREGEGEAPERQVEDGVSSRRQRQSQQTPESRDVGAAQRQEAIPLPDTLELRVLGVCTAAFQACLALHALGAASMLMVVLLTLEIASVFAAGVSLSARWASVLQASSVGVPTEGNVSRAHQSPQLAQEQQLSRSGGGGNGGGGVGGDVGGGGGSGGGGRGADGGVRDDGGGGGKRRIISAYPRSSVRATVAGGARGPRMVHVGPRTRSGKGGVRVDDAGSTVFGFGGGNREVSDGGGGDDGRSGGGGGDGGGVGGGGRGGGGGGPGHSDGADEDGACRWIHITIVGEMVVGVALSSTYAFAGIGPGLTMIAHHLAAAGAIAKAAVAVALPPLLAACATPRVTRAVRSVCSTAEIWSRNRSTSVDEGFSIERDLNAAGLVGHVGCAQRVDIAVGGFDGHRGTAVAVDSDASPPSFSRSCTRSRGAEGGKNPNEGAAREDKLGVEGSGTGVRDDQQVE